MDTFRDDFAKLCEAQSLSIGGGVEIDTIDGFITSNILRPHAYRIMQAPRAAFLVTGTEPFLAGFKLSPPTRGAPPVTVDQIHAKVVGNRFEFFASPDATRQDLLFPIFGAVVAFMAFGVFAMTRAIARTEQGPITDFLKQTVQAD